MRILGLSPDEQLEEVRRRVALLSHASYLYEDLTAEQNLTLFARMLGAERPKEHALELLAKVGLGSRRDNPVREFSAGMRKRLAIARLLLKRPELALLDEPFGELDPAGIAQMEVLIRELREARHHGDPRHPPRRAGAGALRGPAPPRGRAGSSPHDLRASSAGRARCSPRTSRSSGARARG